MPPMKAIEVLNDLAPTIQAASALLIALLTFVLVCATLRYVRATRQIAEAAVEQGEALQKPCITVKSAPRQFEEAVLGAPWVAQVMQRPTVELINAGPGPALKLLYRFEQVNVPEGAVQLRPGGFVNYVEPRMSWETQLARGALANRNFEFRAEYESLSGCRYETRIRIEDGAIVAFDFGPIRA